MEVDTTSGVSVAESAPAATGLAAGIGTWIFWTPVLFTETGLYVFNNLLVGVAIAVAAAYNAYLGSDGPGLNLPLSALVAILGLWTAISPFVLGTTRTITLWSNVLAGLLVAVLALVGILAAVRSESDTRATA